MNLFKKLFNKQPKQPKSYIIDKAIEVKSNDPAIRLQEVRKRNFQRAIITYFNSDIAEVSNYLGRHKNVMYSYIHGSNDDNRDLDDRIARLYELHLRLKVGIFDEEDDPVLDRCYIPFIDDKEIPCLAISLRDSIKYTNNSYTPMQLMMLDTSELDQITLSDDNNHETYHKDLLGYIAVINRKTNRKITLKKGKHTLEIKGEIIDSLRC